MRAVVNGQSATETELRILSERAETWVRLLESRLETSERKLDEIAGRVDVRLREAVVELRQASEIPPRIQQLRKLQAQLDLRARELRSHWLARQSSSRRRTPAT